MVFVWGVEGFNLFNLGGIVLYYIVVGILGLLVGVFYLIICLL